MKLRKALEKAKKAREEGTKPQIESSSFTGQRFTGDEEKPRGLSATFSRSLRGTVTEDKWQAPVYSSSKRSGCSTSTSAVASPPSDRISGTSSATRSIMESASSSRRTDHASAPHAPPSTAPLHSAARYGTPPRAWPAFSGPRLIVFCCLRSRRE